MKTTSYLRRLASVWAIALLWLGPPPQADAAAGAPDITFQQSGAIDQPILAVAVDSRTNIWIGGRFSTVYGTANPYLACLNPDGTLNTRLPQNILHGTIGVVHALDVDDADNVYIAGERGVTRLIPGQGPSWQNDDAFQAAASAVVRRGDSIAVERGVGQPAQSILVAGSVQWTNGSGTPINNIAEFDGAGRLNTAFSLLADRPSDQVVQVKYVPACACGPNTISYPVLLFSGTFGTIMNVGGSTTLYPSPNIKSCAAIRRQFAGYNCPSSYGEVLSGGFFDGSYFPNGDQFTPFSLDRFGGATLDWFHNISPSHAQDIGGAISAIEALDGGDLLVAGSFSSIGGNFANNFAHLLPNGTVDTSFPNSAGFPVFAMAKQPDGKYVLVGESNFSPFTGQIERHLGMPAPRPITFTTPPNGQTAYAGDGLCLSASVDAWPAPPLVWVKDGFLLTNQTASSICFSPVTQADAGDYLLRADSFCGTPSHVDSPSAHLTVLAPPPPPPNDMFANAIALSGASAVGTGYIRGATVEPGEPNNGPSVWWTWTAPSSGRVIVDVSGCDFSAHVAIYTGTAVNGLTWIVDNCVYDCSDGCSCVGLLERTNFLATGGVTYHIAVAGFPNTGSLGNVVLRLNPVTIIPYSLVWSSGFGFQVSGPESGTVVIDSTVTLDPPDWQPVSTNILSSGVAQFLDSSATGVSRFYRVRLQ